MATQLSRWDLWLSVPASQQVWLLQLFKYAQLLFKIPLQLLSVKSKAKHLNKYNFSREIFQVIITGGHAIKLLRIIPLVIFITEFPDMPRKQFLKDKNEPRAHPQECAKLPINERQPDKESQKYYCKNFSSSFGHNICHSSQNDKT